MATDDAAPATVLGGGHGLTTAQVAGLIAFAMFIVQILFNLSWPLITVALLSDQESAVTWSVVSRMINNSYWPTILQSDASATRGVRRPIVWQSYIMLVVTVLIAVTSILTPIGLYDAIVADKAPVVERFSYMRDDYSALGLGTAARSPSGFNRLCGYFIPSTCPGSSNNLTFVKNGTRTISVNTTTFYDISIPASYMAFWSSGLSKFSRSVSSIFDIEYRTYSQVLDQKNKFFNNGSGYIVGSYRTMTNVILNDAFEPVEGLIVDTKNGGVGFRNHTAPADKPQYGVKWTEDILFIEPVTECANMNLTLELSLFLGGAIPSTANVTLVDNGGFANINRTYPLYIPETAQNDPELAYRAYKGAWLSNTMTMLYLNVTNPSNATTGRKAFSYLNSQVGQQHPLETVNTSIAATSVDSNAIFIGKFARFMNVPALDLRTNAPYNRTFGNFSLLSTNYIPPNPFQITTDNFTLMQRLCQGAFGGDVANISNVAGQCGLMMGIPYRKDGVETVLYEPNVRYVTPLYNCASAARAIIKTVTFMYNSTSGLRGLKVMDIAVKTYSDSSQMPLWAVENTNQTLSDVQPLWGLVDNEDVSMPNISYKRAPHLWLTGTGAVDGSISYSSFNLPGVEFASNALGTAYSVAADSLAISRGISDYSGRSSLPLYNRWKDLSRTANGASKIINLIWTDVAANAVVGTKSWISDYSPRSKPLRKRDNKNNNYDVALVSVTPFKRVIKYKIKYAIPAFILIAVLLSTLLTATIMAIMKRTSARRVNAYLNRLAAGRVMTSLLEKQHSEPSISDSHSTSSKTRSINGGQKSSHWVKQHGGTAIDIGGEAPVMAGFVLHISRDLDPSASTAMLEKDPSPHVQSIHESHDSKP